MTPEDNMDETREYLKGKMPTDEAAAFRQRMAEDPALEDKVAFARLMMGGLEEMARQKTNRKRRWTLLLSGAVVLLVIGGIVWYLASRKGQPEHTAPSQPAIRAGDTTSPDASVGQGGGDSPELESDRATGIAWNSAGEVIVAGLFSGSPRFGEVQLTGFGKMDIFLAASSQQLKFQWAKQFGSGMGNDYCDDIAIDSRDNVIITGGLHDQADFDGQKITAKGMAANGEGDFFIAKFDPEGKLLWLDHGGGNMVPYQQTGNNRGLAVATDLHDNIIATGMYIGTPKLGRVTLPEGGPNEDLFLVKYTPAGNLVWAKAATGNFMIYANDMDAGPRGDIYLTGFFGHNNLEGNAVFDGATLDSYGGRDIFVAKYSSNGQLLWAAQAGSPAIGQNEFGQGIAANDKGECYVTGTFVGEARFDKLTLSSFGKRDVFLSKYGQTGRISWARNFGGPENDQGTSLCLDQEGNVYCTGFFSQKAKFGTQELPSVGGQDIFIVKYSPNGEFVWVRQFGGDRDEVETDVAHKIAVNKEGQLVVTGFFSGTMQIGNKKFVSAGREDIFILFFDREGNLLEAKQVVYLL